MVVTTGFAQRPSRAAPGRGRKAQPPLPVPVPVGDAKARRNGPEGVALDLGPDLEPEPLGAAHGGGNEPARGAGLEPEPSAFPSERRPVPFSPQARPEPFSPRPSAPGAASASASAPREAFPGAAPFDDPEAYLCTPQPPRAQPSAHNHIKSSPQQTMPMLVQSSPRCREVSRNQQRIPHPPARFLIMTQEANAVFFDKGMERDQASMYMLKIGTIAEALREIFANDKIQHVRRADLHMVIEDIDEYVAVVLSFKGAAAARPSYGVLVSATPALNAIGSCLVALLRREEKLRAA